MVRELPYRSGENVATAIADVLDVTLPDTSDTPSETPPPSTTPPDGGQPATVVDLLRRADAAFKAADKALADGDLGKYADDTARAERLVQRALAQAEVSDQTGNGGN